MDKKDLKILHQLDKDSRMTFAQIGRNVRLSQETVRYRMKRLEENVITHYPALVNTPKLGYTHHQLMLKLHNINKQRRDELIAHLQKASQIGWIGELEGEYDIAIIAPIKGQIGLMQMIDDLYKNFSQNILKKTLSINISGTFLRRDYLVGAVRDKTVSPASYKHEKETDLSNTEEKLLQVLSENARTPAIEIARQINVSADTVIATIRKLTREHVLLGSYITFNQEALDQTHHKVLIYLNNLTTTKQKEFEAYVKQYDRVIALIRTLGEHDYEIDLEVANLNQLSDFVMALNNEFSTIIRDYTTLRVLSMPKYVLFPPQTK